MVKTENKKTTQSATNANELSRKPVKKSAFSSREISFQEARLTRKLKQLETIRQNKDRKIECRVKKTVAERERANLDSDQKTAEKSASKFAKKHPKIYGLLTPLLWISRKTRRKNAKIHETRPHYSFRLTPRYKTKREIANLGGYLRFNGEVWRTILDNKWLFAKFFLLFAVLFALIVGVLNQDNFKALRDSLNSAHTGPFSSFKALFTGALTGVGGSAPVATIFLFAVNGRDHQLRRGVREYGGLGVLAAAAILTLYWLVPSFLALAVVNVPGMYPLNALHIAGNLAVSRRLAVLFRRFAAVVPLAFVWLIFLGLAIGADTLLVGWKISWPPVVPFTVLILSTVSVVWLATYVYLLINRFAADGTRAVADAGEKIREK